MGMILSTFSGPTGISPKLMPSYPMWPVCRRSFCGALIMSAVNLFFSWLRGDLDVFVCFFIDSTPKKNNHRVNLQLELNEWTPQAFAFKSAGCAVSFNLPLACTKHQFHFIIFSDKSLGPYDSSNYLGLQTGHRANRCSEIMPVNSLSLWI